MMFFRVSPDSSCLMKAFVLNQSLFKSPLFNSFTFSLIKFAFFLHSGSQVRSCQLFQMLQVPYGLGEDFVFAHFLGRVFWWEFHSYALEATVNLCTSLVLRFEVNHLSVPVTVERFILSAATRWAVMLKGCGGLSVCDAL